MFISDIYLHEGVPMKRYILLLPIFLLVVTASVLQADTIHVPSQQPTIQAGIDAAVDGDTVLVADGTYTGDGNRGITFKGKAIVVMSENGPESCIIDCEGNWPNDPHGGFTFFQGEDSTSIVQGFTIMNGSRESGGGISCHNSSPTITGNTITGNWANSYGGGINCWRNSYPTITGNTISGNVSNSNGGGISCFNCSPTITSNTISGNTSDESGGGIYCNGFSTSPTIEGNTISGNISNGGGGGIKCSASSPNIIGNTISGNTASGIFGDGGGIGCYLSSPTITGNKITGNTADYDGGGIAVWHSSFPTINGNTISGNTATFEGGGIACSWSSPTITNCILWGNSDEIYVLNGNPIFTYSNIQGGWSGEGNIDEDPMFVQPDTAMYTDHRLLWRSPCIDTGHPDSLDADSTRSDMGAHYFNQNDFLTLYMTPDMRKVPQGGQMGVTYTIINRWPQQKTFSAFTRVILPDGEIRTVLGPEEYHVCGGYAAQIHLTYNIPPCAYVGMYEYQGAIGVPPSTLYDDDNFKFKVIENDSYTQNTSHLSHQRGN